MPILIHQLLTNVMKSLCRGQITSYLTLSNVAAAIILNFSFVAQSRFQLPLKDFLMSTYFYLLTGTSPTPSLRGLQGTIRTLNFDEKGETETLKIEGWKRKRLWRYWWHQPGCWACCPLSSALPWCWPSSPPPWPVKCVFPLKILNDRSLSV